MPRRLKRPSKKFNLLPRKPNGPPKKQRQLSIMLETLFRRLCALLGKSLCRHRGRARR